MSISPKQIEQVIADLGGMKESHKWWAEYFEADSEVEKEYVNTGEWDDAKTHHEYVMKYERIIDLIK